MEINGLTNCPILCTRGAIVFPEQELIIDVGRAGSMQAITDAKRNTSSHIILLSQKDPMIEEPTEQDLYTVGTLVKIQGIRKLDGFIRAKFKGLSRVKVSNITIENKVFTCDYELLQDQYSNNEEQAILIDKIIREVDPTEFVEGLLTVEEYREFAKNTPAGNICDQIAQVLPTDFRVKQELLECLDINTRLYKILDLFAKEKKYLEIDNIINDRVKDKIDEGQKEYYLREKMRAIKEELGDVPDSVSDIDSMRNKLKNNPYPENIKTKALEELQRYEMLPSASSESGVVKTYLDWILNLPWWEESQDNEDLSKASDILDDGHYGLEKVKERILEYLAVKQHTNSLKSPILCLVGPPGVGKTSLAKSIAEALERKFVKISLGGVKDESEIRGHRRTYLGSLPGRFIQGMKKAKVINPVFLIDEIDKMASDYKGDPASAMLEVLDPEQNSLFSDHYLEEPYDLSKVLFVATANYIENIPEALKDRLEIIELSSYTELEKVKIAIKHLIPKQMVQNGLKPKDFKLKEAEVLFLIRYYTREAGVRQLDRLIATLARKTVLAMIKDDTTYPKVTKDLIVKWLGNEKFDYGKKYKKNQVGVVNGLAYTSFGGDILQIEVNTFKGTGKLVLTGKLGDVMKESAMIALDYIKANATKLKIKGIDFAKTDIHVHVPEGAVPKDGPSAGVTMTTALVSAFTNKKVLASVAMTGEVTLRGNVLAIGGLKEKSLAAHRSGIKTICIPESNRKDLDDIPNEVKDAIKFIAVDHVSQVLEIALEK